MDIKDEVKKSQLLSLDGWESYQKELIRLCFEFWEVSEKQVQLNNSLQSGLMRESTAEIQLPTSLFADEHNNGNTVGFEPKVSLGNIISEEFKNNGNVKINGNVLKYKQEDGPIVRQFYRAINNNIDWQTYGNCSKIVDIKGNEQSKRTILKRFSFYKHSNKQVKSNNKQQSLTFDRYSSCTLKDWRKCKKWLDTAEKIKKHNPNAGILCGNIEENVEKINFDERSDTSVYNTLDIESKRMEQKIKKLVQSINEKDNLLFPNIDVNEQASTKFGPSNKFKYLFKNVFQGSHDELDFQLLDDYTEYINKKLNTWRTLLDCLDDVRQRLSCKVNIAADGGTSEDTAIEYGCPETNKEHRDRRLPITADNYDDESSHSKFVETNVSFGGTSRQRKYNFFKLLNKTKRSVDMRTNNRKRTERNSVNDIRLNNGNYSSNNYCDGCASPIRTGSKKTLNYRTGSDAYGRIHPERMRKSFSDTDLPSMRPKWQGSLRDHGERAATSVTRRPAGQNETTRAGREMLTPAAAAAAESYSNVDQDAHCCRDAVARGLCDDRHECFQTAVARLEYVGSTFREPCRLAGLKILCKVDVLAGFGHPAEAVDLFVQSALPLSENAELMIRKAEAAYDWKFFCHLSMWRHSYKE